MGISIYSKNKSIDLGCSGFQRLRRTISERCPKDIMEHYALLLDDLYYLTYHPKDAEQYDARTEKLYEKYKGTPYRKIINFLYAPDTDAKFGYGTAKSLLKVIGNYDDEIVYGYAGWGKDAARFKNFKELLNDAYETKRDWGWY